MEQRATAVQQTEVGGVHFEHTHYGSDVEMRGSDGSFCRWNLKHYLAVKAARTEQLGLQTYASREVQHDLIGKELLDTITGETYTVEKVVANWWRGRFLVGMLARGASHRQCVIQNHSCQDPAIQAQAQEFGLVFQLKGH